MNQKKPSQDFDKTVKPEKPANRKKLGRGLGALLGEARREEPLAQQGSTSNTSIATKFAPTRPGDTPAANASGADAHSGQADGSSGLVTLSLAAIEPNPDQPRKQFDETALDELAASIASRGVIQPVIVRPVSGSKHQIVAGERRWRAAQKAQLHEIPVIIRDLDEREVMALALIENIQREDLNPVEEARGYKSLAEDEGLTQAEIAKLVDKSRSHVANMQRLLALPDGVLAYVEAGELSMGHARALIGHEDAEKLAGQAVKQKLSVRDVEKLVRQEKAANGSPKKKTARDPADNADIAAVQNHLEEFLGMAVRINTDADPRSGALTIRYRTLDQLDLICQRLTGGAI